MNRRDSFSKSARLGWCSRWPLRSLASSPRAEKLPCGALHGAEEGDDAGHHRLGGGRAGRKLKWWRFRWPRPTACRVHSCISTYIHLICPSISLYRFCKF